MALVYKGAALEPWTSQHYSFVREKQERREQFSTGRNDTRFIVLLQSHVIQFQRVDIRFHSFMFIQQKKNLIYIQYFSKMMQRMTVNFHQVSRRKLVWALVDERLNWKAEIKLPNLPVL